MPDSELGSGPREIHNVVTDSTVQYLVQIGVLRGDLNITLPPLETPLERAEQELARSLLYQWRAEADAWDMADPEPLAVRWVGSRTVTDPGAGVSGRGDRVGTMAEALLGLNRRRLVILGDAGSGKTTLAVLLTLELLARRLTRSEDVPVPIVLSLESWDAERVNLYDWLTRRIKEEHPGLPRVDGAHPARRLVRERRLLPVLDSLDELPEHRRIAVLGALDRQLGHQGGVVLICRTEAYAELVGAKRELSSADSVIEALPLGPADVATYLGHARQPSRAKEWEPLLTELRTEPNSPVTRALSTPLMVWLTRRGYELPPSDPAELVNRKRFPTAAKVERHLLDRIVPAAFPRQPNAPDRLHPPRQWDPERAQKWLAHLARLMNRQRTAELAWWRLYAAPLPRTLAVPVLFAVGIGLSILINGLLDTLQTTAQRPFGFGSTLGLALVFAGAIRTTTAHWFGDRTLEPRRRANPLRFAMAVRSVGRDATVGRALRLTAVIGGPVLTAALMLLYLAYPAPEFLMFAVGFLLPGFLTVVIAAPSDTVDAATPDALMRSERLSVLLTVTVVAPLIGVGIGLLTWLDRYEPGDWAYGLAGWCGACAMFLLLSPWSRWVLAKWSLALAGRVPWSLMEFLRDAHRAGLLQRTAGTYRFRNVRLQEHLAAAEPSDPTTGVARPAVRPTVPKLRTLGDAPPAMSEVPPFTVRRDATSYLMRGKGRRLRLAHWKQMGVFMAFEVVFFTVGGKWHTALGWTSLLFMPTLGVLLMVVVYLRPPQWVELHITDTFISSAVGRRRCSHAWSDVEEVAIRRLLQRGRSTPYYGIHVRLREGAPTPARSFRSRDGWFVVLDTGFGPTPPPDIAEALADFAGPRWRP